MGNQIALAGAVSATLLLASGCGSGESGPSAAEASASEASASASEASASAAAYEEQLKARRYRACSNMNSGLIKALKQVDSRLAVGLDYSEYGDRLGDARVEYDNAVSIAEDGIAQPCLQKVGTLLEDAFDRYADVLTLWGDCIEDYTCDFSAGETNAKAQRWWAEASQKLDRADTNLDEMKP